MVDATGRGQAALLGAAYLMAADGLDDDVNAALALVRRRVGRIEASKASVAALVAWAERRRVAQRNEADARALRSPARRAVRSSPRRGSRAAAAIPEGDERGPD